MKQVCYCGGHTNVFCSVLMRVNSRVQAYCSVPIRDETDAQLFALFGYDFQDRDNCGFGDRTLDGLGTDDLIARRCHQCGDIAIAGFPTQLKWTETADGRGAFFEYNCQCGAHIVCVYDFKEELAC